MSAEVKLSTRHALRVLRPGAFRRYIVGSVISDTGTWMQVMAQGYVMSTLTDKALLLGMANLAAGLPMLLLTMIGGSAADRFDKRKILLATQYVQIALAISIGFLIMSGKIQIWHILGFAVLLGISNSFEMPTLNAFVPELVTRDEIQSAIAVDRAVFHGSRVVGPALAGIFISAWGAAFAFFCNAVSFGAMIVALFTIPPRQRGTAEEESKRASGIKDGFRYVAKDKPSLAMIGLIAATTVFIFPIITVMMPLYVRLVLGLGADRLGYLMGASAVGSVIGAIFLITLPRRKRVPIMMVNVCVVTCAIFTLSRGPSFYVATAVMILNSLGLAMNFGLANTIVQERAPDYLRGRVSAVFMLSFVGLMPVAGLGITGLSDLIGMRTALAIAAVCYGVIALTVLARVRQQCLEPIVAEGADVETPAPPVAAAV
ncbi:MAG TPA: MFS transporter [Candidatus Udaeobacter sp.]|jgi:MFS family permease|nr:MFS transporter [Candidatus Udaeobacter sp.]